MKCVRLGMLLKVVYTTLYCGILYSEHPIANTLYNHMGGTVEKSANESLTCYKYNSNICKNIEKKNQHFYIHICVW